MKFRRNETLTEASYGGAFSDKKILKKLEAIQEDANYLFSRVPGIFQDMDIKTAYRERVVIFNKQ